MMGYHRVVMRAVACALGFLLIAGCTGPSSASPSGGSGLTHISVGVLPIIDDAALFIALQHGLFRAEGLDVTPVMLSSGELSTQDLLSGHLQFAFSNYVTIILAASQGAKLRIVADGSQTTPDTNVIMTPRGSRIQDVQDLRGKTIALNAAGNIGSLMVDTTLETYSVPVNSVKVKVIPFPQMAAALRTHAVDAAWMAEPFITESGEQAGAEELVDTASGEMANFPTAGYETLAGYAQRNPATVAAFQRAIVQAQALAADRSVVEHALPTYVDGMTTQVLAAVHLDSYPTSLSQARLQQVADAMLGGGMLKGTFDTRQLLAP
jgi:NitT/TauT family transport system substrate-binding protein